MNKCTYCGREADFGNTKFVGGYEILECCPDCEEEIIRGHQESRYTKVITIDNNEFGYFEYDDTLRVMVFNDILRKQQVITYDDSPGEARESIERVIREGFNFWGWEFKGRESFNLSNEFLKDFIKRVEF